VEEGLAGRDDRVPVDAVAAASFWAILAGWLVMEGNRRRVMIGLESEISYDQAR
jgi:hypothetical protein